MNEVTESGDSVQALRIEELIAMGYRRISRKHGLIARIDRPDWRAVLAADYEDYEEGRDQPGDWEDYYRRVRTHDTMVIDRLLAAKIPGSSGDPVGYIECVGDEIPRPCVVWSRPWACAAPHENACVSA